MKAIKRAFLSKLLLFIHDLGEFVRNEFSQSPLRVLMFFYIRTLTYCMEQNHAVNDSNNLSLQFTQTTVFTKRLNEGNSLVYIVKAGEIIGRKKFKFVT